MTILKSTTKTLTAPAQRNTGRRSFIWKAGAALSAGLVATVPGMARTNTKENHLKTRADQLSRQITRLEDEQAIRELHRTYETLLDNGRYTEVAALFTDNAAVIFNGGLYRDQNGISRLYRDHFSINQTGRRMEPAPGVRIDADHKQHTIEIAADGKSASARFPYSIQAGAPLPDDCVLVQMARLHGEGIRKWCESGVYAITYVKDAQKGNWKIARLEHRVLARTDYQPGMSQAKPTTVAPFDKVYPEEPTGPDRLMTTRNLS